MNNNPYKSPTSDSDVAAGKSYLYRNFTATISAAMMFVGTTSLTLLLGSLAVFWGMSIFQPITKLPSMIMIIVLLFSLSAGCFYGYRSVKHTLSLFAEDNTNHEGSND